MKKLYKLNIKNNYIVSKKIVNFLNPEFSCIDAWSCENLTSIKHINKYKLLEENNLDSFSSISGNIEGIVNIEVNGKIKKSLFIKNNFKEKESKTIIKKVNNEQEFLDSIKFSSFIKLFQNKDVKNIVVNGIIDEPLVITESYILKSHSDKIIDVISKLNTIFNFEKSIIVLKNTDNDHIGEYLNKTASYTHMDIVALEDFYMLEKPDILLDKLHLQSSKTVVIKPSELLELRHFIRTNSYMCEKYISVIDTINKKTKIAYVKKNIIVSELLNKMKLLSNDYKYIKNGIITGKLINENKEIITKDFNALFIIKNEVCKKNNCINCGKCVSVCPAKINPIKNYKSNVKDGRCTKCGLCTLLCPMNINLKNGGNDELH